MSLALSRRLVVVGRLVVARGACTRSTPLLDGARIRVTQSAGTRPGAGEQVEWDAGGVRVRLSRPGGPGHALVPALDVGWRGLRTPNPHTWPFTRRGRDYRRRLRRRRFPIPGDECSDGFADLLEPPRSDGSAGGAWPFV